VYKSPILIRFMVLYVVLNYNVLIWTLGLCGTLFTLRRKSPSDLIALSNFLIPVTILVSLQHFYDHYFLIVIPFLCILSGIFLSKLFLFAKQLPLEKVPHLKTMLMTIIIGITVVPYVHSFPLIFYSYAGEPLYNPNKSLIQEKKVGHFLEVHTSPSEKIFALEPKYVFLANREMLCKYTYFMDPYILNSPNRANILNEILDTLISSKVNYAVFESKIEVIQQRYKSLDTLKLINYIRENYVLEAHIGQAFIYRYKGN